MPAWASTPLKHITAQEVIVLQLYKDFSWEVVISHAPWAGLLDQPRDVLEQYFDDKLVALILNDRACTKKHGLCKLDFSPIWASNNPAAHRLEVRQTPDPRAVAVSFAYPGSDQSIELTYQLSKGPRGWRIHNIKGPDWSLLSILDAKHESQAGA